MSTTQRATAWRSKRRKAGIGRDQRISNFGLIGGGVFSTSSIAWPGALAHNNYQNNVSRITKNVLDRFIGNKPLED